MDIIEFWKKCKLEADDYIHPDDCKFINEIEKYKFAKDLLPVPYCGDLVSAKIIILMINPGQSEGENEYIMEANILFKSKLKANIYQNFKNEEFPFFYLDPSLSFHPGYNYWFSRFKKLIKELKSLKNISDFESQKFFAKNIAILELVPYHSKEYKGNIHKYLPSSLEAKKAFLTLSKDKLIIIPRKHKAWGYEKPKAKQFVLNKNVLIYFNQAAYFGKNVRKIIIDKLLDYPPSA